MTGVNELRLPTVLDQPEGLLPRGDAPEDGPVHFDPYQPKPKMQRRTVSTGLKIAFAVSLGWLLFHTVGSFQVCFAAAFLWDFSLVAWRYRQLKELGKPKHWLLFFPFITICGAGVALPAALHVLVVPFAWHASLACLLSLAFCRLAYHLVDAAIEQDESHPSVSEGLSLEFQLARKKKEFRDKEYGYLITPPEREYADYRLRFNYEQNFRKKVNELLSCRVWSQPVLWLLPLPIVGLVLLYRNNIVLKPEPLRLIWPVLGYTLLCFSLARLVTRRGRARFGRTLWVMQVFVNASPQTKDLMAAWAPVRRFGFRTDRRLYFFFAYVFISVLVLQLFVFGPLFVQPYAEVVSDSHMSIEHITEPQALFELTADQNHGQNWYLLFFAGLFVAPPLFFVCILTEVCGRQLQLSHELFSAPGAMAQKAFEYDPDETPDGGDE